LSRTPNGVYLFFDDSNEPWYVGKATSRSFVERIPSHFDPRPDGWFGTLPKKTQVYASLSTYREAIDLSLSLQLLIVGVPEKGEAGRLERFLRSSLRPKLNPAGQSFDLSQPLTTVLTATL
jgi:hypothetical protein